jgi:ATP-dependent RNA helicase DDX31/DBP7
MELNIFAAAPAAAPVSRKAGKKRQRGRAAGAPLKRGKGGPPPADTGADSNAARQSRLEASHSSSLPLESATGPSLGGQGALEDGGGEVLVETVRKDDDFTVEVPEASQLSETEMNDSAADVPSSGPLRAPAGASHPPHALTATSKGYGTRKQPAKSFDASRRRLLDPRIGDISRGAAKGPAPSRTSNHIFAAGRPGSVTPTSFAELGLAERLTNFLTAKRGHRGMGLGQPTVCQSLAVPAVMEGNNVMLKSETGSGKTLAYLLPIISTLSLRTPKVGREQGVFAIVLAPTRELTLQISEVLEQLLNCCVWIVGGAVTGGEKRKSEKARLRKGINIVVATPGRLLDHLKSTKSFDCANLRWLVLDEADRLVDLGFEKQVQEILDVLGQRMGEGRGIGYLQSVMVSATVPVAVSKLGQMLLGVHKFVDADQGTVNLVSSEEEREKAYNTAPAGRSSSTGTLSTPQQLVQHFMAVPQSQRLPALAAFLRHNAGKMIVFLSTCDSVDFHCDLLKNARWPGKGEGEEGQGFLGAPVFKLHGNIGQSDRLVAYRSFSRAPRAILFCTDVAARGLDLPQVDWIVQYDPPVETSDYVHRVGRTARRGKGGRALLFLLPSEVEYVRVLSRSGLKLEALSLQAVLGDVASSVHLKESATVEALSAALQQSLEGAVQREREKSAVKDEEDEGSATLLVKARLAFQSHIRAYGTHGSDTKDIFQVRGLHLGHVARSFALRDPPAAIRTKGGEKRAAARGPTKVKVKRSGGAGRGGAFKRLGLNKKTQQIQLSEFA